MGKPSSHRRITSKDSNNSLHSNQSRLKMQAPLSSQKIEMVRRKKHNKTGNKIKSLFGKLRRQSEISLESNDTVISLDDHNETIVNENDAVIATTGQKRKISNTNITAKRRKSDNSLIVVADDDIATNNATCSLTSPKRQQSSINCSTPINRKDSKSLQNMIINNFPKSRSSIATQSVKEEIINLTKEINRDSYLTIDLTEDSDINKTTNTVIEIDKTSDSTNQGADCTHISLSNTSLSMSGDSDVTVLQNNTVLKNNHLNKFAKGIAKLNSKEKGKLLELIAQNIFSGCKISKEAKNSIIRATTCQTQATETSQNMFIKEVILGETKSRNSIGSNIYHPSKDVSNKKGLRMVVIDGSNVAMEHTKGSMFSVKGLKICIDYFLRRGHVVKAFVPRFRCKYGKSSDPRLLDSLERQGVVVYTPSREIQGRTCVPYDDRYIVQCAAEFDGVIVTGDNYRDLHQENPRWRFVIENRLLPFTWVDDMIMFPKDPMGRNGPSLEQFLKHPVSCTPGPLII